MVRGFLYRIVMKISHKYNWHYAPPIYPEGNTQLWCKWCGFRQTIKNKNSTKIYLESQISQSINEYVERMRKVITP